MGRKIRTDVHQVKGNLIPKWKHIQNFRKLDAKYKQIQNYDRRHGVKTLPFLPIGLTVLIDNQGHRFQDEYYKQQEHCDHTSLQDHLGSSEGIKHILEFALTCGEPLNLPQLKSHLPPFHGWSLTHRLELSSISQIVYNMRP